MMHSQSVSFGGEFGDAAFAEDIESLSVAPLDPSGVRIGLHRTFFVAAFVIDRDLFRREKRTVIALHIQTDHLFACMYPTVAGTACVVRYQVTVTSVRIGRQ